MQGAAIANWDNTGYQAAFATPPTATSGGSSGFQNIARLKADGATAIWFQVYNTLAGDTVDDKLSLANYPDRVATYTRAVTYARSLGLSVWMKPHIAGSLSGRGIVPTSPAAFFNSVRAMVVNTAAFCRAQGLQGLVIGTEMGGSFSSNLATWQSSKPFDVTGYWRNTIIPQARTAFPGGLLTYAATNSPRNHNSIEANEFPYIDFWDLLDYLAIDDYPDVNLSSAAATTQEIFSRLTTGNGDPWPADTSTMNAAYNLAPLRAEFASIVSLEYSRHLYQKAFGLYGPQGTLRRSSTLKAGYMGTERGVPGVRESLVNYWGSASNTGTEDWPLQARAMDALCQAQKALLAKYPGYMVGWTYWQVLPWHTPGSTTPSATWRTDFDFIDRPAEAFLKAFYLSGSTTGPQAVAAFNRAPTLPLAGQEVTVDSSGSTATATITDRTWEIT